MTGWIIPIALAGLTFAGLALPAGGSRRAALEVVAAALLLALAGYAWQGSPDMPGHPAGVTSGA